MKSYTNVLERDPNTQLSLQAAQKGAPVAHLDLKDYNAAVRFYRHIIYKSSDEEERKSAQRYIAQIYFENLLDYDQAIVEYESLLRLKLSEEEIFRYRFNVAKCHYNLANMGQAMSEAEALISQFPEREDLYDAKVLKANILLQNKKHQEAAEVLENVVKQYPDRAKKENLALSLVSTYEDLKEYDKAMTVLEEMRPWYSHPDFLNERIKRMKQVRSNLPGAQGWKR